MFSALLQFLQGGWDWFSWFLREIWRQISAVAVTGWGLVLLCAGMLFSFLSHLDTDITAMAHYIDNIAFPSVDIYGAGGPIYSSLALANTFLPLTELFGYVTIYITFIAVLQVVRGLKWAKSWFWAS